MDDELDSIRLSNPKLPAERDIRLDFLRGTAILIILLDHFRYNVLASLTPRNFGFSDMAEILVFVSGCACGMVYGRVFSKRGFFSCQIKALRRIGQLLIAGGLTVIVLSFLDDSSSLPLENDKIYHWFQIRESGRQLIGILTLYCYLLAVIPIMAFLRARHWLFLFGVSFVIYGISQVELWETQRRGFWSEFTPFNPFAWQFLFFQGVLLYPSFVSQSKLKFGARVFQIASIIVIELVFVLMYAFPDQTFPLTDKSSLEPLRLLHGLSVIMVMFTVLPRNGHHIWKVWPIHSVVTCGQNSLFAFCAGSVFVVLIEKLWKPYGNGFGSQISTVCVLWTSCWVAIIGRKLIYTAYLNRTTANN